MISAPQGTPVQQAKASVGPMSVVSPSWLELLQGEELAHVSVEPPRAGTSEPFPDDLDPRVASALVGILVAVTGPRWPTGRSRYDAPDAGPARRIVPREDPVAAWDSLSGGADPTRREPGDPDDASPAGSVAEGGDGRREADGTAPAVPPAPGAHPDADRVPDAGGLTRARTAPPCPGRVARPR